MAVNQFDKPYHGQYVSMYTPLPFEELSKIAQMKQQTHDVSEQSLDKTKDALNFNLANSLKVYTPEGIRDESLGWNENLMTDRNNLESQKQKLISDYYDQKITEKDFQKGVKNIIGQAQNLYSKYKPLENISKSITDTNEQILKNEDFGSDTVLGHKYLDYNTQYLNNALKGNIGTYSPVGIANKYEQDKNINEAVQHFMETDLGSGANAGQYITEIERYGVQSPRVQDYVNRTYTNSRDFQYHTDKFNQAVKLGSADPKDFEKYINIAKENYAQAIVDKVVHERKKVNLQGDPYRILDYKQSLKDNKNKEELIASLGITEAENQINYEPDSTVKDFINPKTGKFDLEYGVNNVSTSKYSGVTGGPSIMGTTGYDNSPSKWIKQNPIEATKKAKEYIYTQADRLGIDKLPNESENDFATRVINENKLKSQAISKTVHIDDAVATEMDKYLIGKDGSKFSVNYDGIIPLGEKGVKPTEKFMKDIDPKTIKHNNISFDKNQPGYILFSAKNKDGEDVQFYAKSKSITFKDHLKDVNNIVNVFKDYYSNKNISTQKINIEDKKYTMVGKPLKEDNSQFLAINSNGEEVMVILSKQGNKVIPIELDMNQLKTGAVTEYLNSGNAKPFTRKIKETLNFEFNNEEE